jgi:glycosyltransferase involved in cell wall biosynthesis
MTADSVFPLVTIIAPCRNEAKFIKQALVSILRGDYPPDKLEMLVVDGMSIDGTREIVQEMAASDNRIRLIDNPELIVPTAMNRGIKAARGEYIMRVDCHTVFSSDYVQKCIEVMLRTSAWNVGGYIKTLPGDETPIARGIAAATSSKFGVGNSAFRLKGPEKEVDTVPFGTYRRELFDRIGYYDERLVRNQDIELNSRIHKANGKIIISPEIQLSYFNRSSFRGMWQQSFNNGLWNPYTIWLTGGGLSLRHFIPMLFVVGTIVLLCMSLLWPVAAWLLAGYLLIYLAVAMFFAIIASQQESCNPFLVLWSFVVLHVAYGLGSLWAILTICFKFPNRRETKAGKPLPDRK